MVSAGVAAASALQWLESTVTTAPKDRHEAAAFFVHACLLQHGFRPAAFPSPDTGAEYVPEKRMPEDWNSSGYGGKYKHHQSGLTFEVRMVPLGSRLLANATVLEQDDRTYSCDLRLDKYVRDDAKIQADNLNWNETYKNIQDFASMVQLDLAYKMLPDSAKTVDSDTPATSSRTSQPEQRSPLEVRSDDPLRAGPPGGYPRYPTVPTVGADDLLPAGLVDPRFLGGVPGYGGDIGRGQLVGPDHPLFAGRQGPDTGIGGPRLPRGAVPPGARFDPFGPPGAPGGSFDPSRFGPDPDHERPPDMYW